MICAGGPPLYALGLMFCMQGAATLSRAHRIQKLPRLTGLIALIEIYTLLLERASIPKCLLIR